MSIAAVFLLLVISVAVVAYPLLPGQRTRWAAAHSAQKVSDRDIERAVRELRVARGRGGPLCPGCGTGYQPGDQFCAGCGEKLPGSAAPPDGLACPSCGKELQADDQFCPRCGQPAQNREDA